MVLGQSDGAPALQRSAAEVLAAAAAIGDSAFAQALLRRVVEAMAGTANPVRCAATARMNADAADAGCIHKPCSCFAACADVHAGWQTALLLILGMLKFECICTY